MRIRVQTNAAAVGGYFAEGAGEYYADGTAARGEWGGRAAARLGLAGRVDADAFARLCGNRHPATGEPLTPRSKATRRVGWDVSFHCPKSVSLLAGLTGDPRLLTAFRTAVSETMTEFERDARTRVRRAGADGDRVTGNLAWAVFVHLTARPVGGVVDPHLHAHCFVANLTFDESERRFKAVQPERLYRDARYFEAAFHARLAIVVRQLGYDTHRTRTGWEVAGFPAALLRRFSRRTELIERVAAERGITDARDLDELGARTRERKPADRPVAELRREWWSRLTAEERRIVYAVHGRELRVEPASPTADRDALVFAAAHSFERQAVAGVRSILAAALRAGVGEVTPESVAAEFPRHPFLSRVVHGEQLVTTVEVAQEERTMVAFARDGRGTCRPFISSDRPTADSRLSDEQRRAIAHILGSADRVTLVRGAAGTGKTTLMAECARGMGEGGKRVVVLAPTAEAARGVLRREGFPDADTLARFLTDRALQTIAAGQVVWVDEAGLVGGRDLARLFALSGRLDFRVVLGGDRFQHGSVARGSVLRLLESEAGLVPAEVATIRRQSGRYRRAVSLLSRGRIEPALDILDALGWVREIADEPTRLAALAEEYLAALREGRSVLVVSPTHAEGGRVTAALRSALRAFGRLDTAERTLTRLDPRDLTEAERGRPESFATGDVIEFHARADGFRPGERWEVAAVGRSGVGVRSADGRAALLPLYRTECFQVFAPVPLLLAVGDRVRVTRNARAADGRTPLVNGVLATVTCLRPDGGVELDSGVELPSGFGHLTHGYVTTSHAAQGKTVDRVIVAESTASFPAGGREQFYVSVSRGRERAIVFTDDALALRQAVAGSDSRPTAAELLAGVIPLSVLRKPQSLRYIWPPANTVRPPPITRGVKR